MSENVNFYQGSKENYNPSEMQGGLYFSKDSKEILLNGESYGNATPADEEDITAESGNLKLKDRVYDEANFSGKGYKILRKNIAEGKNVLTLDMISDANTIYEIRYDFDLNGATITIPEGCTLKFEGGSISNGTINGDNTSIISAPIRIFNNINIEGDYNISLSYCEWFGGGFDSTDSTQAIKSAISLNANQFIFYRGAYNISESLQIPYSNLVINLNVKIKAINSIDCMILFDFSLYKSNDGLGDGVYSILKHRYITGGGLIDGNGLAKTGIGCKYGLFTTIENIYIANTTLYGLQLNYGDVLSSGYVYVRNLEFFNTINNKDVIAVRANRSDSVIENLQIVNYRIGVSVEKSGYFYNIHPWLLDTEFATKNNYEVWKTSASFVFPSNISSVHFYHCEADTMRYLFYKEDPIFVSLINQDSSIFSNTSVISLDVLEQYPLILAPETNMRINWSYENVYRSCYKNDMIITWDLLSKDRFWEFTGLSIENCLPLLIKIVKEVDTFRIYVEGASAIQLYGKLTESQFLLIIKLPLGWKYFVSDIYKITMQETLDLYDGYSNLLLTTIPNVVVISDFYQTKGSAFNIGTHLLDSRNQFMTVLGDNYVYYRTNKDTLKRIPLIPDYSIFGSLENLPLLREGDLGMYYFNTTIGKPMWFNGTSWIDPTENIG